MIHNPADGSCAERASGAARRRRERRLRSWLKHERQTVRMVLAETFHHSSAPFPPKFKEEWVGRHEQHAALRGPKTARTKEATHFTSSTMVARGPELFSLEEEPGGGRPAPVSEVAGWQEKVERHFMEDLGELAPLVQILDLPVPQMVETTLQTPCGSWISRLPSRLSKCPRSPALRVHHVLSFLRRSQRNSWWKCRPYCLLCGSRSRSSALQFLMVVVKVLSQDRVHQRLANAFLSELWSRSSFFPEQTVEQIVDTSPGDGCGLGSSSSAGPADEDFTGGFRTFPHGQKKCGVPGRW